MILVVILPNRGGKMLDLRGGLPKTLKIPFIYKWKKKFTQFLLLKGKSNEEINRLYYNVYRRIQQFVSMKYAR
jgi:hypothetical protein